ncbi:hypothetical protein GDO78_020390 [Eleutherodactylus coqui]|uniref:Uncharacterized protein n=1 Tax=Eleutherodactylus coqui TaxID=57060 RepID=A0A8J6B990_ELECQ|nr:hypothetical protein GDO78_020390 [Eleutherodactylus coqui]
MHQFLLPFCTSLCCINTPFKFLYKIQMQSDSINANKMRGSSRIGILESTVVNGYRLQQQISNRRSYILEPKHGNVLREQSSIFVTIWQHFNLYRKNNGVDLLN